MDAAQLEFELKLRSKTISSVEELLADSNFKKDVLSRLTQLCHQNKLQDYEIPKNIKMIQHMV